MQATEIVLLVLVGIGAGFVQRVSGFGFGIFVMMFLPHFAPSHVAAVVISTLAACGISLYNVIRFRRYIEYKTVWPMIIASMVVIPIAVYCARFVSGEIFGFALGGVLILLSIYFLLFSHKITVRPTKTNGVIAGALAGVLGGMFSTSGPPAVLYLVQASTDMTRYFATIQFYFCFTNLYTAATRAVNGDVTWELLLYAVIVFAGCLAGGFIGGKVFLKLNPKTIKTVIYIGMIISGILMMI